MTLHSEKTDKVTNGIYLTALSECAATSKHSSSARGSSGTTVPSGTACLLELVLSGAAYLGGEPLSQLLQAPGVLQLDLGLPAEELLQVLQQLQARLRLLLQAFELLHQLSSDFCTDTREEEKKMQHQQQALARRVVLPASE